MSLCCVFVFFFKQKTAYEMRISDWSSDVCSSDLDDLAVDRDEGKILIAGAIGVRFGIEEVVGELDVVAGLQVQRRLDRRAEGRVVAVARTVGRGLVQGAARQAEKTDRKSTRLNSSH